jgi:hypothetical protein
MKRLLLLLALVACNPDVPPYYLHNYQNEFPGQYHYDVHPNATTPEGIRVDTSGLTFDLALIDVQTDQVEQCLAQQYGTPPVLPPDLIAVSDCDESTFPLPLRRQDLVVKVAADWQLDCAGTEQVLPAPAPEALCDWKVQQGLIPACATPSGCHWRAGIEDNRFIVVPPSAYLYKDPLIRMSTGCNNPWAGTLSTCAHPTVPQLP